MKSNLLRAFTCLIWFPIGACSNYSRNSKGAELPNKLSPQFILNFCVGMEVADLLKTEALVEDSLKVYQLAPADLVLNKEWDSLSAARKNLKAPVIAWCITYQRKLSKEWVRLICSRPTSESEENPLAKSYILLRPEISKMPPGIGLKSSYRLNLIPVN